MPRVNYLGVPVDQVLEAMCRGRELEGLGQYQSVSQEAAGRGTRGDVRNREPVCSSRQ